jgi:hypothetical protein
VRNELRTGAEPSEPGSIALSKFRFEVAPLEFQLTVPDRDPSDRSGPANPLGIESIATLTGLDPHLAEVRRDCRSGPDGGPETLELRMLSVAESSSAEYRLRKERFAPYGDETSRIQERRVKGPKSHNDTSAA